MAGQHAVHEGTHVLAADSHMLTLCAVRRKHLIKMKLDFDQITTSYFYYLKDMGIFRISVLDNAHFHDICHTKKVKF